MGTVYSTLGARLDVVEMLDGLMLGADRDLVSVWQKFNAPRFDRVMLKTKTTKAEATKDGIKVTFDQGEPGLYDMILVSVGRTPNGKTIGAEKAGVAVNERGFIPVDTQMRTNVPNIFAIGDIAGNPMLAHKAVHEGHVAAEAAAGLKSHFDARVVPSVAYTDPEIAWVGVTEDEAKKAGRKVGVAKFPWAASGRAIANARDEGFTKLIFDAETHRIVGGGIVGTGAGDLISELALAVEMGADATDIGKTIHPHPTLGESVGMAAELFEGVCTDLPPQRKKAEALDRVRLAGGGVEDELHRCRSGEQLVPRLPHLAEAAGAELADQAVAAEGDAAGEQAGIDVGGGGVGRRGGGAARDHVLQLAQVARPVVAGQPFARDPVEGAQAVAEGVALALQQRLGHRHDVVAAFGQRRQGDQVQGQRLLQLSREAFGERRAGEARGDGDQAHVGHVGAALAARGDVGRELVEGGAVQAIGVVDTQRATVGQLQPRRLGAAQRERRRLEARWWRAGERRRQG